LDKLDKIGLEKVLEELLQLGVNEENLNGLKNFLSSAMTIENPVQKLEHTEKFLTGETSEKGISEMRFIFEKIKSLNLDILVDFDFLLARGLNYYTGAILEVKSLEVPMGSICGGGRYDNLTDIFGMPDVSGVGMSFGADRIYDVLESLQRFPADLEQATRLFVANFIPEMENEVLGLCLKLRENGISLDMFPDSQVKLKKQLNVANQKKISLVLIPGEDEIKQSKYTLKNMNSGEQFLFSFNELIDYLKKI